MSHRSSDPIEELRHADPVRSTRSPSDSKARVWARIEEVTMEQSNRSARGARPHWALGLAAAVGVAAVAAFAVLSGSGGAPSAPDDPGIGIGSCVETYSIDTLANREFAFDAVVTAIDGDRVTFSVNETFRGDAAAGDSVTLEAAGMTGTSITSAGGPNLTVGERYLVAGDAQFAWACGFTQPYDEAVAADWAEAAR